MSLTGALFLLGFFGGLGMCIFRGPVWGLYTYLAVFYLDPPTRWWGASLPNLRWSLLAAIVTLIFVFIQKRSSGRPPFTAYGLTWILALYVVWMWLQTPFVLSVEHLDGAILFTKYLILLYIIYEIVDTPDKVRDFFLAHVAGCFYLGWLAFNSDSGGRLEGVGGPGIDDANTMSMHLGTAIVIGAMLLLSHEKWRFWFVIGGMPFILNAIVLGNSRGAVLGILAGGLVLFALKPAVYRKQFVMFGALGVVLIGMLAHDEFWERLSSLRAVTSDYQEEDLDFSARSRVGIIEAQWRMFLDHPFGVGHAGTEALSRDYLSEEYLAATRASDGSEKAVRSSHNTFMSVLVDQGIPGIVLLSALIFWAWRSVRLTTRRQGADSKTLGYAAAVGAALTVAAVAGQFSPYLKVEVQIWLLAILMSLVSFARGETSTAERTQPARQRVRRPIGTMGTAGMRRDRGGA